MIRITGKPSGLTLAVVFIINATIFLWSLYFIYKVAQYVGAWPFA